MKIFKNIIFLILVLVFSYLIAATFFPAILYETFFPSTVGSGFFGFEDVGRFVGGIAIAYIFLLTLVFTIWGVGKKYWWMGVLLLPALAFVIYFDLARIWFYALLGLAGWAIGLGISKLLKQLQTTNV